MLLSQAPFVGQSPLTVGGGRASQAYRLLAVDVQSLPPDSLLLLEFDGEEALSSLFRFELKCVSEVPQQIKLENILERSATIRVRLSNGSERSIHGIVSQCSCDGRDVGGDKRFTHYTLEVVPWLWLLSRTSNCRIFQDKTVPEIIKEVFEGLGFQDFRDDLIGSYYRRDYCVQYRESDFDFVSRLMEEEGIFYFFEHEEGHHTLVLADSPQTIRPCPKQESVRYEPEQGIGEREDVVQTWSERRDLRPGKFTYRDNHFQMPGKPLEFNVPTLIKSGRNERLEMYDFPGAYTAQFNRPEQRLHQVEELGERFVRLRMEEEEAQHLVARGKSSCRAFCTGSRFRFSAPSGLTSGDFLLTSLKHRARCQSGYVSGETESDGYENAFTCIPASVPFRPQRQIEKPLIHGTQTAVVVGPPGEEIYPDKFGRVKVQFHWDRKGQRDEHSSCWIRTSQTHAAPGFGCMSLPRIGEEVIVSFMEGDPDQPIIIGRVYNAANMPPFDLPKEMTRSGIKSKTHKGAGYNEMTMDDTAGAEQIRIHGQHNMDTTVGNNETHAVGVDRMRKVGNNEAVEVGVNQSLVVGTDQTVEVGSNQATTVGANQTTSVGDKINITAGTSITLQCGASMIHMTKAGVITISGTVIAIAGAANCSMTAPVTNVTGAVLLTAMGTVTRVQGGSLVQVKGPKVDIEGSNATILAGGKVEVAAKGELTAKGAPIKLN